MPRYPLATFPLALLCFLAITTSAQQTGFNYLSPHQVFKIYNDKQDYIFLDVRSQGEYKDTSAWLGLRIGHISGATNISVQDLPDNLDKIKQYKDRNIIVYCSHSYRSRVASGILADSGFKHVYNMNCGLSEFYKLDKEANTYAPGILTTDVKYRSVSGAVLYDMLQQNKDMVLIEMKPAGHGFMDSVMKDTYAIMGGFKNAKRYTLDELKASPPDAKDKTIVVYSAAPSQSAEAVVYLADNGYTQVYHLFGGLSAWYNVIADKGMQTVNEAIKPYRFMDKNKFDIISVAAACRMINGNTPVTLIDTRSVKAFNDTSQGQVYNYTHLKKAVNLPGADIEVLLPYANLSKGTALLVVDDPFAPDIKSIKYLTDNGYKVSYIPMALREWEWEINNYDDFGCKDALQMTN